MNYLRIKIQKFKIQLGLILALCAFAPMSNALQDISLTGTSSPILNNVIEFDIQEQQFIAQQVDIIRSTLPVVVAETPNIRQINERNHITPIIGVPARLPILSTASTLHNALATYDAGQDGTILGVRISSPGAKAIRVGIVVKNIPAEVSISFAATEYDANNAITKQITGAQIMALLAANVAAGDHSDAAHTYWAPMVSGEDIIILFHIPLGIASDELKFTIPSISHIFQDLFTNMDSDSCSLDVTCYPDWADAATSVAKMLFTRAGGYSSFCTGSLINDSDTTSHIPYFLTAYHCIANQTVASTLETHWFLQASSCDDTAHDQRYVANSGGAQLLYANNTTDTAFMRLNDNPPDGVYFLGWSAVAPEAGANAVSIYHSNADLKKISFATISSYLNCTDADGNNNGSFGCANVPNWIGQYFYTVADDGIIENNSNGSALLNDSNQIIGQFRGGTASCSNPDGVNVYGRFDIAYKTSLHRWLGGELTPTPSNTPIPTDDPNDPTISDDHGDNIDTATIIAANSSTEGIIENARDKDYFRIEIASVGTLSVYTTGTVDTYGYLFYGSGRKLAGNDNADVGTNSITNATDSNRNFHITRIVRPGTYYVGVLSRRNSTGSYVLVSEFNELIPSGIPSPQPTGGPMPPITPMPPPSGLPTPTTSVPTVTPMPAAVTWLTPATVNIGPNSNFILDFTVNSQGRKIGAYDFALTFDPDKLQVDISECDGIGVCAGSDATSSTIPYVDNEAGTLGVVGFDISGVEAGRNLQLLLAHFKTKQTEGQTPIELSVRNLTTPEGIDMGTLSRGATVNIAATRCGDVNNDGAINIVDALMIARNIVGLAASTTINLTAADVNNDNAVSIVDALIVARYIVGISLSNTNTCLTTQ